MPKNKIAAALGRMARGVKKTKSPEAVQARIENMKLARAKRWAKK